MKYKTLSRLTFLMSITFIFLIYSLVNISSNNKNIYIKTNKSSKIIEYNIDGYSIDNHYNNKEISLIKEYTSSVQDNTKTVYLNNKNTGFKKIKTKVYVIKDLDDKNKMIASYSKENLIDFRNEIIKRQNKHNVIIYNYYILIILNAILILIIRDGRIRKYIEKGN